MLLFCAQIGLQGEAMVTGLGSQSSNLVVSWVPSSLEHKKQQPLTWYKVGDQPKFHLTSFPIISKHIICDINDIYNSRNTSCCKDNIACY